MPKMKTSKAAAKRFKVTKSGKIKRKKAYSSHIMTKKSAKRRRNLRKSKLVDKSDLRRIKQLLPGT
jgi:large subunit ribosomal protein L35